MRASAACVHRRYIFISACTRVRVRARIISLHLSRGRQILSLSLSLCASLSSVSSATATGTYPVHPFATERSLLYLSRLGLPFCSPPPSPASISNGNGEQSVSRDTVENKDRVRRVRNAIGRTSAVILCSCLRSQHTWYTSGMPMIIALPFRLLPTNVK